MKVNPLRKSRVPGEGWDGTNLEQLNNATHEPFVGNWSTHESLGSNSIELELRNFDVFRSVFNGNSRAIKIWTNRCRMGPPGVVPLERDQIRRSAAWHFRLIGVISGLMRSVNRQRFELKVRLLRVGCEIGYVRCMCQKLLQVILILSRFYRLFCMSNSSLDV